MIRSRSDSNKHLDDLVLHRWEDEGGALCPSTRVEKVEAAPGKATSRSTKIDPALNGYPFKEDRLVLVLGKRRPQANGLPRTVSRDLAKRS
jgi:hypothetical protein